MQCGSLEGSLLNKDNLPAKNHASMGIFTQNHDIQYIIFGLTHSLLCSYAPFPCLPSLWPQCCVVEINRTHFHINTFRIDGQCFKKIFGKVNTFSGTAVTRKYSCKMKSCLKHIGLSPEQHKRLTSERRKKEHCKKCWSQGLSLR